MSREIDAAVATAMGLEVFLSKDDYFAKGMPHAAEFEIRVEYPAYYHKRFKLATIVPLYSSSIAAAWQVVEWMEAQGWLWSMRKDDDISFGFCRPEWITDDLYQSRAIPTANAETPELAICYAFLKVTGTELPQENPR